MSCLFYTLFSCCLCRLINTPSRAVQLYRNPFMAFLEDRGIRAGYQIPAITLTCPGNGHSHDIRSHFEIRWICFCYRLNRHQTILQTFLNFFLNLTLPGVSHLYKQLPNGQYLSDLCKMCNLDANLWKSWIGDHRILTYIFKWERLNTAGHSHSVSIGHSVAPLHND